MKRPKITIVGAGNIGATTAHSCAGRPNWETLCSWIYRPTGDMPHGEADRIFSRPARSRTFDARLTGTNELCTNGTTATLVVITAGMAR